MLQPSSFITNSANEPCSQDGWVMGKGFPALSIQPLGNSGA